MCTLTYLPISTNSFLLTQSRDESPQRPAALFPVKEIRAGKELLFPKDPVGGGSWIATDQQERLVCLMNGAFEEHIPQPPYRLSRGQVLLDAAAAFSKENFANTYNLAGIEPFTLLFFERKERVHILELRWDGRRKFLRTFNPGKPHIWSSSQIYSLAQQKLRESWFRNWLSASPAFSPDEALDFHCNAGDGNPEHSLLLRRRDYVRTVSISQAQIKKWGIELRMVPLRELEKRCMKC